jgi:hypothetical protein
MERSPRASKCKHGRLDMDGPFYITLEELTRRLSDELPALSEIDRAWWSEHRVEPFVVESPGFAFFAVAVSGRRALVFFDDEDEFGYAELQPGGFIGEIGYFGDLSDAVPCLRRLEQSDTSEP